MGLIKKSCKFFSEFFQAPPDSEYTAVKPQARASLLNKRDAKRRASLVVERTMRYMNFRGKKRRREKDDGDFFRRKMRLVRGGAAKAVVEEGMDRDNVHSADISHLPSAPCASPATESVNAPESFEELMTKLHSTLEKLSIIDTGLLPGSITYTQHTCPETHEDLDWSWLEGIPEWENRYRARRCHSDSSTKVPPYANAVTDALPDDGGRRSAPPNLDATWSLTSHLAGCVSPECISGDESLDEVFESPPESRLKAKSESERGVEVKREVKEVGTETEVETELEETEVGEAEVGEAEVGEAEVGEAEVGEAEVGEAEVGEAEVGEAEMREASVKAGVEAVAEAIVKATTLETAEAMTSEAVEATSLGTDEATTLGTVEATTLGEPQAADEPELESESASSTTEPVSELIFRRVDSPSKRLVDLAEHEAEQCFHRRQVTADDVASRIRAVQKKMMEGLPGVHQVTPNDMASRIRAVQKKMMEGLLDVEQKLRPHCSGGRG